MSYQPIPNPLPVSQSGSWSISFSSAQAVTQSGTWNIGSITTLPSLVAGTAYVGKFRITDGTLDTTLLNSAPGSDTGQVAVPVRIISSLAGGSGGTSLVDAATFTRGSTSETPVGGIAETSAPSLTTGKAAALSLTLAGAVRVDGSSVTQPVSIAAPVAVTGTFWQTTQPVSIASTVAVSGPLTDTQLRATAVPVSGTFWQTTQPVSLASLPALTAGSATIGSVKITDGTNTVTLDQNNNDGAAATEWTIPTEAYGMVYNGTTWDRARGDTTSGAWVNVKASTTIPVSGTFWQATQPVSIAATVAVSGPLTDTQLRATAVPVSGTFWQATQPVSISGNQAVNNAQIAGVTTATGNGVVGTGVQRVAIASDNTAFTVNAAQSGTWNIGSITTLPALVAGSALIGKVGIDQTTVGTTNAVSIAQLGTATVLTGVGAAGTGSLRVTLSSDAVTAAAALADGFANPTIGQRASLGSVFNGTTWDRQRGMGGNSTTGDSGAKTATGNGVTQTNVGNKGVQIVIALGTVSGTTPTCVFKVQASADGGTTWVDIPGATTASLTATGVFGITIYPGIAVTSGTTTTGTAATANMPLPRTWRMAWTIGGTTPSFTITNIQYNYLPN